MDNNEFDYEYMKKALEDVQRNFEQIAAETILINKQSSENKQEEQELPVANNKGYTIELYFDNSDSSREILFELAKKSLVRNCSIKEVAMGIIAENTIY